MRLIDADALMDVIKQHEYRLATKQGSIDYGMFTLGIQQAVDEQPTVDAVPVVRCKGCKHAYINSFSAASGVALCTLLSKRTEGIQIVMKQDDFCYYGERKDGDGNG